VSKIKARGILWLKSSLSRGALFEKHFAVLEKGKMDFYRSEEVTNIP
jgi:hypothetical protein